jgi:hypothetical protein
MIAGAVLIAGPDNHPGGPVGQTTPMQVMEILAVAHIMIVHGAAREFAARLLIKLHNKMRHFYLLFSQEY